MQKEDKIYVAGHRGLVGSAIVRALTAAGFTRILARTREELDLLDKRAVMDFFLAEKPDFVFDAAAHVGGILANRDFPADFILKNLEIQNHLMEAALKSDVQKFLFLGSSCIYPRLAPQPIREEYLLTGELEETNKAYAIAKIAGISTAQSIRAQHGKNFISAMPTNLYGQGDNFDLTSSHVLPALIRKFHEAKERGAPTVTLWGSGSPRREFLHVDDLARACIFLMASYDGAIPLNIGTGEDISIRELAELIRATIGYEGEITWDTSKPDGTPRKLLDVSKINALGWKYSIPLDEGVRETYAWYTKNLS